MLLFESLLTVSESSVFHLEEEIGSGNTVK